MRRWSCLNILGIINADGGAIDATWLLMVITIRRIGVYIEAAAVAVGRITKDDILIKADGTLEPSCE